jgi:hypothetical protein
MPPATYTRSRPIILLLIFSLNGGVYVCEIRSITTQGSAILKSDREPSLPQTIRSNAVYKCLRIALVGYLLGQIEEDSYASDHDFYEDQFGIGNTRERVLGIGPGVSYLSPAGLFIEGKVFFETLTENRFEGYRPTLRVVYKRDK